MNIDTTNAEEGYRLALKNRFPLSRSTFALSALAAARSTRSAWSLRKFPQKSGLLASKAALAAASFAASASATSAKVAGSSSTGCSHLRGGIEWIGVGVVAEVEVGIGMGGWIV